MAYESSSYLTFWMREHVAKTMSYIYRHMVQEPLLGMALDSTFGSFLPY
jgi:hypothetical protein